MTLLRPALVIVLISLISKMTMANSERHDTMELYTKITIKDLQEQVPQVTDYTVSLNLKALIT